MKLFYKVYLFLILVLVLILAGSGWVDHHREVALFNDDMAKDAILIGKAMSGMIEHVIHQSGTEMARKLVREANLKEHNIHFRWVQLDSPAATVNAPAVPLNSIESVMQGRVVSLIMDKGKKGAFRFTYVPVDTSGGPPSAIELSESLAALKKYIRDSTLHLIAITFLLLLSSGMLLWFQFQKWIHRPLSRIIDKSRRIGKGDLAPDLVFDGRDEFAELCETLNTMCRDLSESWEAARTENERRIEALEQLRHSERLATLGRISAGMAHEFGTPLNVIHGRSKMIRSGDLEHADIVQSAGIIGEQTEKIIKIMQNLLDFARRRKPKRSPQDMAAVAKRVIDMLAPTAGEKRVYFQVVEQESLPMIPVDPLQIQQVLTNLVINGMQAMTDGGRVEVALEILKKKHPEKRDTGGDYLAMHIKDEGRGIQPENIAHIFEPFFTTKDVGAGTGLGLSIVYGIVQEHDGWIEVESTWGKGSCFTVYLPIEVSP
ncbi:MAG: HAMP domain-containing protein [Deltaproteobacteria bacterium]|nr:HAMP domain-containing protein [Deltaproteobacteria bacterium]